MEGVVSLNVAVVLPGQGSQFVGMADPWIGHHAASDVLEEASSAMGLDLVEACRDQAALARTEMVQPAMLALDVAAFRAFEATGVAVAGVAGHSLGEFAALVAAGVLELREALEMVLVRGRAMQAAGDERPGTMTALLGVGAEDAAALCDEARGADVLVVANENSPQQVVISGSVPAVERAESLAAGRRIRTVRLDVAGAFHSALMEPAVEPLSVAIDAATFSPPRFPVAANVTGELVRDPAMLRDLLKLHVVSAVRWERCARALAGIGVEAFVETGPGDVLTKLAKRATPVVRAFAVGTPERAAEVAVELG
ncbi:MAG TPA: ACP S-malonyltransferase [Actinomycetota bacterium]|nr:ACP S-malonyltransferase [Actinomycetota bacterium]